MRLILILIGAAVVAYFLAIGLRAYLNERNQPTRRTKK